ncbi:glycosyltransferase family 2 protein [Haladaptatus sp. CMSO5]|uniref:glycosyltransferase family 2 protein n=1 Tax=Haladaptatus sp. CMSO5 TaxID=3120514 RepID=UPI002FCDFF73
MSAVTASLDARYATHIESITDYTIPAHEVLATVVVTTATANRDLLTTVLDALDAQTETAYDVIVVDRGTAWNLSSLLATTRRVRLGVRVRDDTSAVLAHNIGAQLATGPLLIFLADDAVPTATFVEAHLRAHRVNNIVAARGRVLPHTAHLYNATQPAYDLGSVQFPTYLDLAGNLSFDRDTFRSLSGFDDQPTGNAALDWTRRALEAGIPREKCIYYPEAVTSHDYATDFWSYLHRRRRDARVTAPAPPLDAVVAEYDERPTVEQPPLARRDRLKLRVLTTLTEPLTVRTT